MNEELINIINILSLNVNLYLGKDEYEIVLSSPEEVINTKRLLDSFNIKYTDLQNLSLYVTLKPNTLNVLFFYDEHEFLKDYDSKNFSDFVILKYEKSFLYFSFAKKESYNASGLIHDNFVPNTLSYIKLLDRLMSSTFADYLNNISNEIIFYTSAKGVYKLKYPIVRPRLYLEFALEEIVENVIKKMENQEFVHFFKNEIMDSINISQEKPIIQLVTHLSQITDAALRNYEIYKKNFSFEVFNDKLQTEKNKYFGSLREILGKILTQLVGIPISISASLFATYNIKDNLVLMIIVFSFLTYNCFLFYILVLYLKDVNEIQSDFRKDFNLIVEKSGLKEEDIKIEKVRIEERINNIKMTISIFGVCLIILATLFFVFTGLQIIKSFPFTLVIMLIMILYNLTLIFLERKNIGFQ